MSQLIFNLVPKALLKSKEWKEAKELTKTPFRGWAILS